MAQAKITAVRGMNDLLPAQSARFQYFEQTAAACFRAYGYRYVRTPVLESTAVFKRGLGEVTDIVEKEMYTFVDSLNGESLTMRPENTAGVVRAAIEHNLVYDGPCRLWYLGPMYRHERPQRGRYREFFQAGAEAFGFAGPDIEVEQILMMHRLWQALEIGPVTLQINTLGQAAERQEHRQALVAYLQAHRDEIDADAQRRIETNPLRVLDSKHERTQACLKGAPRLLDYLGEASLAHFQRVQTLLAHAGVPFEINERLVRGMDYYNLTVFEWVTDRLGAQATIGAGGRYDGLFELLGGKATPGCGFAIGVERVLALMEDGGIDVDNAACDAYIVHQGNGAPEYAQTVAESLRSAGLDIIQHAGEGSFKSQMKKADASGAVFAILVGEDEISAGEVTVKVLRAESAQASGQQQRVALADLANTLLDALCGDDDCCDHHHSH
jgi:histidyl-tRNA synthetase